MRLIIALGLASACSSSMVDPATEPTVRVDISRKGGFAPTPAAGSTCTPIDERYTLTIATQRLEWQRCESPTFDGIVHLVPGQATLSDPPFEDLWIALNSLEAAPAGCGGDITDRIVFAKTIGDTTLDNAQCLVNENAVFEQLLTDAR